jgi:ring-1,2-phenylacetyl-CoA epoxidase subunit PaaA
MYGSALIEPDAKPVNGQQEDPVKLAEFEARIARGEKIEPDDWMPALYRKQVLRMIEQHAHSEIIGALPEGTWITRAPTLKRKLALIAKVQDEVGHGHLLYSAAETLGKSREAMINDLINGKSKYSNIFNYPAKSWADIAVIGFLVDAGAIVNQLANAKGSYGPYCRALERICYEESFHLKQGYDAFVALAVGTPMQRAMLQDALNRWWFPPMMHFFGPPDTISIHTETLMRWKVKMASNEEMRQDFIEQYVPKIWELGMTLPDPALKKNADGKWEYTQPDWEEFFRVINGDGPCNKERIAVRRYAEENGRWVREALMKPSVKAMVPYA